MAYRLAFCNDRRYMGGRAWEPPTTSNHKRQCVYVSSLPGLLSVSGLCAQPLIQPSAWEDMLAFENNSQCSFFLANPSLACISLSCSLLSPSSLMAGWRLVKGSLRRSEYERRRRRAEEGSRKCWRDIRASASLAKLSMFRKNIWRASALFNERNMAAKEMTAKAAKISYLYGQWK